jgi:type IV pilus assembly protein PilA
MLLNRLFHLLSVKLSMIPSSRHWQIEVAIAALTLPVVFSPVSEAQVSQTLKAK